MEVAGDREVASRPAVGLRDSFALALALAGRALGALRVSLPVALAATGTAGAASLGLFDLGYNLR